MERAFLVLGAVFGLSGVVFGAFGSHALRSKLTPDRLATFETGVRYQLWHALALFAVVLLGRLEFATFVGNDRTGFRGTAYYGEVSGFATAAGWLFVAGIVLFSGSLYALSLTEKRAWGAVTPFGGACMVLGWVALLVAALT
jgi:uncharacterized membrane protein YgdD (TMEM256/DUF423 family)